MTVVGGIRCSQTLAPEVSPLDFVNVFDKTRLEYAVIGIEKLD
jgi:hypothetical protein